MLAVGVRDELPAIEGLAQRWGRGVFHCPYHHGYELDAEPIGIIAASALAHHHAIMLPDWGTPTLIRNDAYRPTDDEVSVLEHRGTNVEFALILRIEGVADVVLADGRTLVMNGLFIQPHTYIATPSATQLGCHMLQGPLGASIQVDAMQQTSVANVFACGDVARPAGNVATAVADGALAGAAAHRSTMI